MMGVDIHDTEALRKLVEVRITETLWGQPYKVKPRLVDEVFGRGDRLIYLMPIMTRPDHYFVRVDSSWDLNDEFRDHLDDIYDAIADQYGPCHCEECCYGRCEPYRATEDRYFPGRCLGGGCSWGEQSVESLERDRARQAKEKKSPIKRTAPNPDLTPTTPEKGRAPCPLTS